MFELEERTKRTDACLPHRATRYQYFFCQFSVITMEPPTPIHSFDDFLSCYSSPQKTNGLANHARPRSFSFDSKDSLNCSSTSKLVGLLVIRLVGQPLYSANRSDVRLGLYFARRWRQLVYDLEFCFTLAIWRAGSPIQFCMYSTHTML